MLLVIGASGYVGSKICQYLEFQDIKHRTFSLRDSPDTVSQLHNLCSSNNFKGVLNCTAYTGDKSIEDCENNIETTIAANVHCTQHIVDVCIKFNIPMVHVSSGCIFNGNNDWDETCTPFFNKSVYSRSKIAAEKIVMGYEGSYICRMRLPFDYWDHPKNLLSKLIKYTTVTSSVNSMTNISDFALIAVELLRHHKPYGIYNIVNPGVISLMQIKTILTNRGFSVNDWKALTHDDEDGRSIFTTPRSNTTLSAIKIQNEGFILDDIESSIDKCLDNWNNSENIFW